MALMVEPCAICCVSNSLCFETQPPKKRLRQGAALKGGLLAAVHVQSHAFCVCLLYLCMLSSLTFLFVFFLRILTCLEDHMRTFIHESLLN